MARELTVQVSAGRGNARLPVLRRAVAGTSAKAGLSIDRIDEAILILEALLADAHTEQSDVVHLILTARPGSFEMTIGPFPGSEAERLLADAELPLVGAMIERLATSAHTIDGGSHLLIVVDAR